MADRTTVNTPATGTALDIMTDERTVPGLSGGVPAKVQYVAEIGGTPDSQNVADVNSSGERLVIDAGARTKLDAIISSLSTLQGYVDGLEGYSDGLEGLVTSSNTKLDSVNTAITALQGYVDQIEGYTDQVEGKLDTLHTDNGTVLTGFTQQTGGAGSFGIFSWIATAIGWLTDTAWDMVTGSATIVGLLKKNVLLTEAVRAAVADTTTPAPITDAGYVVSGVEYTRPADATAYAAGDAVGNSTSAITPMDFGVISRTASGYVLLRKARIQTDLATCTWQMRVHLYNVAPTTPANDNSPFSLNYADKATHVGFVDVPALSANAGAAVGENDYVAKLIKCAAGQHVIGLLEVRNAPAAPAISQKIYTELSFVQIS